MTATDKLLTARQVAEYLGMHVKTLCRLLREDKIPLNHIRRSGHTILFRPADVENYLRQNEISRTGAGSSKPVQKSRRNYLKMTDAEAQKFFEGLEHNKDGEIISGPFETEKSYPDN